MNDQQKLEQSLATLLGFELEDVSDVMEHLLTFDSPADLHEYLTDFLGPGQEDPVNNLVSNILKFQNGTALESSGNRTNDGSGGVGEFVEETKTENKTKSLVGGSSMEKNESFLEEKKPVAVASRANKGTKNSSNKEVKKKSANLTSSRQRSNSKSKVASKRPSASLTAKKVSPPPSNKSTAATNTLKPASQSTGLEQATANLTISQSPEENSSSSSSSLPNASTKPHQPQPMDPSPSLPPIGKASIICGCYGTIHKYLTNCLHCGRIQCEREGYGYCPHCGHLVQKVIPLPSKDLSPEERHKERLLQFDREVAQRTQVIDERADEYENSSSQWLTEEERAEAERKDELKRAEMHSVKKATLNIAF